MKKLLCIVCLLTTILCANVASAAIGSPMRHGYGFRPTIAVVTPVVTPAVTPVIAKRCIACGHVRPIHFGYRRFHGRHFGFWGHHRFAHRRFAHVRHFKHYGRRW